MTYRESISTKIIRRTFIVDGVREGITAEFFQKDLGHVPQKARLTMIIQHDTGSYEFHFEYDQVDQDA